MNQSHSSCNYLNKETVFENFWACNCRKRFSSDFHVQPSPSHFSTWPIRNFTNELRLFRLAAGAPLLSAPGPHLGDLGAPTRRGFGHLGHRRQRHAAGAEPWVRAGGWHGTDGGREEDCGTLQAMQWFSGAHQHFRAWAKAIWWATKCA